MTSLQLLASVVFAAIFVTIFASLYINYQAGEELNAFERGAEDLAKRIQLLGNQDAGAVDWVTISIPSNCELRFKGENVIAVIGESQKSFNTGVSITGPAFSSQSVNLKLERTDNGVEVSVV